MGLAERYKSIRLASEVICNPLQTEDMVVQPVEFVSPPKWHLGHITWFFEVMILQKYLKGYKKFNPLYDFVFNSYYEALGKRVVRTDRGNLTRPTVSEIMEYREYVDVAMLTLINELALAQFDPTSIQDIIELGLQHEQQHQELLLMDIKYILGNNPLQPKYVDYPTVLTNEPAIEPSGFIRVFEGLYTIGHHDQKNFKDKHFAFDNEGPNHRVFVDTFHISETLLNCGDVLRFIGHGGYENPDLWTSAGLAWVRENNITAPLYWYFDNGWKRYDMDGPKDIDLNDIATHLSWYEANAIAKYYGKRLPTEAEWEIASTQLLNRGMVWEHTGSAYLPYPGFKEFPGEAKEYNGKFMINQMVLRGSSFYTPKGHADNRNTYRNFFQPHERWFLGGVRLAY